MRPPETSLRWNNSTRFATVERRNWKTSKQRSLRSKKLRKSQTHCISSGAPFDTDELARIMKFMSVPARRWRQHFANFVQVATRGRVRGQRFFDGLPCPSLRWWWTPWTYRFDHGGWVFLSLRWFWRF